MTLEQWIAVVAGIVSLAIVAYGIWLWGPGVRRRSVDCPVVERRAVVVAEQQEAEFGCLQVADITACSLLGGQPVTCAKRCIQRL